MKHHEENYNVPVSTISTDLSLIEYKCSNVTTNSIPEDICPNVTENKNESKDPFWKVRYGIALVLFFIYFYFLYVRLNMSITLVAMVNHSAIAREESSISESCPSLIPNITGNKTRKKLRGEFNWSPKIQGLLHASYSIGQILTRMPAGLLVERYGAKWFAFGDILIAGVCTLLIPFLSHTSLSLLIMILILRGLAQGVVGATLVVFVANWFPKTERGSAFAFTISGSNAGSCLGSIISGFICDSAGGWRASYYLNGGMGVFLALLTLFFLFENPKSHPRISKSELNYILSNQENALTVKRPKLPWRKVLTSFPVYVLIFTLFGQMCAATLFWTMHSTFLANILHYPIRENGLLTALPFAIQFLLAQIASWTTLYIQKKKLCKIGFLRKFWTLMACVGSSACLFGMYLSGCNRTWSVIFSILCSGCTGLATPGCWVTPTDMSPTFAGSLNALCITLATPSTFLTPVVVGYLIDEKQTIEQWNKVFFLTIGILMSSGIVYTLFGSAEVQPWNFVEEKPTETDIKRTNDTPEKSENDKIKETRF